jgi:hypothetical protein
MRDLETQIDQLVLNTPPQIAATKRTKFRTSDVRIEAQGDANGMHLLATFKQVKKAE